MKGCRPLSDDEVFSVLESFSGPNRMRNRALFLLGIKSGFRISELLSLRLRDVIQAGRLVDRVTVQRRHMKRKLESRTLLLHPEAKAALAEWIEELRQAGYMLEDTFVFQSQRGPNKPISRVQAYRVLKKRFDQNEMIGKLGTHSMRKTFADRIYDRLEGDLVKTQKALGHKNINSTVQYLSFREEEIDEAILAI